MTDAEQQASAEDLGEPLSSSPSSSSSSSSTAAITEAATMSPSSVAVASSDSADSVSRKLIEPESEPDPAPEPAPGSPAVARRNGTGFRMHSRDVSHDDVPDVTSSPRRKSSDYSKPIVERKVVLQSSQAQREFEHCWVRTDYSLYIATKAARAQWRLDDARRAEKTFDNMFAAFREELGVTVGSINDLIEKQVDEANRGIVFDHVRTQKVPVRTGYSTKLIEISEQLDKLIAGVELLEINNVLSAEEADKTIRSWSARYRHFCAAINKVRVESLQGAK